MCAVDARAQTMNRKIVLGGGLAIALATAAGFLYYRPLYEGCTNAILHVNPLAESPSAYYNLSNEMLTQLPGSVRQVFEAAFADGAQQAPIPEADWDVAFAVLNAEDVQTNGMTTNQFVYQTRHYEHFVSLC